MGMVDRSGSIAPSDSSSAYRTPDPDEERLKKLLVERVFHGELVKNGGRAWYPINLLEGVSKDPERYRELLCYWRSGIGADPDSWDVFEGQYYRWHKFRTWREKRRKEFEGRISEYTGWAKRLLNRHFTTPFEFEFDEDSERQDPLTTWIEYLTYEYNFYINVSGAQYEATKNGLDLVE